MKMLCTKKRCKDKDKNGFCKHYEELIATGKTLYCEYGVVNSTPEFRKPRPAPAPTVKEGTRVFLDSADLTRIFKSNSAEEIKDILLFLINQKKERNIPTPPTTGSNAFKPPRRVDIFTVNHPRDSFFNKQIETAKEAFEKDSVTEIQDEGHWEKSNPYLTVEVETKRKPERGEVTAALLFNLIEKYCKRFEKIIICKEGTDTIKIKFENKR